MSTMSGRAEIAINNITIPSSLLSAINVELTDGTRERNTLGGRFTNPSGILDSAMAKFTIYLPSIDYLKNIFPSRFNSPTAPQTTGNIVYNADNCSSVDAGPVNIHWNCEDNDNNDIYFYNAEALLNFTADINPNDVVSIEVTLYPQPDDDGNVYRLGTGDLTADSIYDATTETTIEVA